MKGRRALIVGEALIDVVVDREGQRQEHPGGSPANVALGLARLGRPTDLLTSLGVDSRGEAVSRHLSASGVNVLPNGRHAPRTSTAVAHLDESGAATYEFDLDWDLPEHLPDGRRPPIVVHTGSIAATLKPGAGAVAALLGRLKPTATVTYDPNARPIIMGSPEVTRVTVERLVALADVVKASDEDLAWLYPGRDLARTIAQWAEMGPSVVVVTLGGAGAHAITRTGIEIRVPTPAVEVADTVGAGDSLMAGLLDGLWRARLLGAERREALRRIDASTLKEIVRWSVEVAAVTVTRAGADPPNLAEMAESGGTEGKVHRLLPR